MATEKPFEREVLDRLITMETKIDGITTQCPQCQIKIDLHAIELATLTASSKSAHHRIDGVYYAAGILGALAGWIANFMSGLWGKGGH